MEKHKLMQISNKYIRRLILLSLLIGFIPKLTAQPNTLFFMDRLHQSDYLNPASQNCCNAYLGIPPFFGLSAGFSNSGFDYNDLIRPGTGLLKDSLRIDLENIKGKLGEKNYVLTDVHIPIINVGFWAGNSFFSFELANKTKMNTAYPKTLIALSGGNIDYIGTDNPAIIQRFGPNLLNYNEFSFGWSRQLTYRLSIGAKLKYISGIAAIQKRNSNFTLTTADTTYAMSMETDLDYTISAPVEFSYDENGLINDFSYDESKIANDLAPTKNPGFGIDLGAIYQFSDRLKVFASVTDIGLIRWNKNSTRIYQKGVFEYSGFRLDSLWSDSDYSEAEALGDSLSNFFRFGHQETKFTTSLNTNLYLGISYEIATFLNFGLVSKTSLFDKSIHQDFTFSANFRTAKSLSATISYSIRNREYKNIGLGIAYQLGPFQIYTVTDNLYTAFMPKNSKTAVIMAGLNLNFGCNRRMNKPMLNQNSTTKKIDFL